MGIKESKLYLDFFIRNILFILVPTILLSLIGLYSELNKGYSYKANSIFEFNYDINKLDNKMVLVDEAVTLIRSLNLQRELSISEDSKITVYRRAPLLIDVTVNSKGPSFAYDDSQRVSNFLASKYQINKVGQTIFDSHYNYSYLNFFIYLISGLSLGITLSLIIEYLKKY